MRSNPMDADAAKKAYASAQYSEVMDINRFAEMCIRDNYCLLHVILNLLHVIAYGNKGSTFDISTQVLSCVFYNHIHCCLLYTSEVR